MKQIVCSTKIIRNLASLFVMAALCACGMVNSKQAENSDKWWNDNYYAQLGDPVTHAKPLKLP